MTTDINLWDINTDLTEIDIEVPEWANGLTVADCMAIQQGGCASGAWMPAVTYYTANKIMAEHGDEVLEWLENQYGELPQIKEGESWTGMAVFFLSCAVEGFVSTNMWQIEEYDFSTED